MSSKRLLSRLLATGALVTVAVLAVGFLYTRYVEAPWTRSGQIDADILRIAPRVGGMVVNVPVTDNQVVKKGDLLFEIDPSDYEHNVRVSRNQLEEARASVASLEAAVVVSKASVDEALASVESANGRIEAEASRVVAAQERIAGAKAGVDAAKSSVTSAKAILLAYQQQHARAKRLAEKGAGAVATAEALEQAVASGVAAVEAAAAAIPQAFAKLKEAEADLAEERANEMIAKIRVGEMAAGVARAKANLKQAEANLGTPGEANFRIRSAVESLHHAEHHLEWTKVLAPADGRVINLKVYVGDLAAPGKPMLAFVNHGSITALGFFRETQLKHIAVGDRAVITIMGHPDAPLEGEVMSVGFAISPPSVANMDGPGGLVPVVQPSFDWIRLAQRVPVRVKLTKVPPDVPLIAGTTASVAIER